LASAAVFGDGVWAMIKRVFDMGEILGCFSYIAMIAGLLARFTAFSLLCKAHQSQCRFWQERAN
jgi:hypothetical protein